MADTQTVTGLFNTSGGQCIITNLVIHDEDDLGGACQILFLSTSQSIGTEQSAGGPNISDANARVIQGIIGVTASDYVDLGGNRVATLRNVNLLAAASSGSSDFYVATIINTAGTYTSSGVRLDIGVLY